MSQEIFVQCIECNRIYPATRDETGTVWTTTTTGCPQCGETTVRDITNQGANDQSYAHETRHSSEVISDLDD
jgi:ssDNA-binding Zn-finger/Zn-ribbon topoisomerase 1